MAKKMVKSKVTKTDDSKIFAFLGVFLTVIGFLIVYLAKKEDKYAMFYAKQGLVLFIAWVIAGIAGMILFFIPFIGMLLYLVMLVLWIIGIVYSLSGQEKAIPLIGNFAEKINL